MIYIGTTTRVRENDISYIRGSNFHLEGSFQDVLEISSSST